MGESDQEGDVDSCTTSARARGDEDQVRERKQAEAVARLALDLNTGRGLDEVARIALTRATELLGGDDGCLFLFEEGRQLRGAFELPAGRPLGEALDLDKLPSFKRASVSGRPVYLTLPEAKRQEARWLRQRGAWGTLVMPLAAYGQCIGLMLVNFRQAGHAVPPEHLAFAEAIAAQCALTIDRTRAAEERERLLAEVQRRAAELEALFSSIADGLLVLDLEGRILRTNPTADAILRFSEEERHLPLVERVKKVLHVETSEGEPYPMEEHPGQRALGGETVRGAVMRIHPPVGRAL